MRIFWEGYGDGEPTVLLLPTWSIVHSRCWKVQIPYLARHCRVITFDGRGNGRSDRPAGRRRPTRTDEFAADALAVMDATGDRAARVAGRALVRRAVGDCCSPPSIPSGSTRIVFIAPGASRSRPADPEREAARVRRAARDRRGLGEVQPPLLAAGLPRLPRVLLRASASPSRTRPSRSRTASAGRSRRRPETLADTTRGLGARRQRRAVREHVRARALPDARHPRRRRPVRPARAGRARWREPTGGELVTLEGAGHVPDGARPGRSTCCCATSRAAPPPPARWRAGRGPRASGRCTSPRRSGSATPGATSRSPTSCARCIPTSRSTGSPSTR